MADQLQLRGGTTAEHSTFTGALREVTVDTDKDVLVVHDNATAGGHPLMAEDGSNSALALGSAGTPSLKFTGDTNTGVFSPGADQLAVSTAGVERVEFGTTEAVFNDGGADYNFRVEGDTNANLVVVDASADSIGIGTDAPGTLIEIDNAAPYVTLKNNTHEDTDGGRESRLIFEGEQTGGEISTLAQIEVSHDGTGDDQQGKLVISTNDGADGAAPTAAVTIDSSQRVGIGTSSPGHQLTLRQSIAASSNAAPTQIKLENASDGGAAIEFSNSVSGAAKIALGVEGTGGATDDTFIGLSTSVNTTLSEKVRITSGGNVGIGTTSPGETVDVNTNSASLRLDAASNSRSGNPALKFLNNTGNFSSIFFGDTDDDDIGSIQYVHGDDSLRVTVNASERARIDSSGRLLVGTSSSSAATRLVVQANSASSSGTGSLYLLRGSTNPTSGQNLTEIQMGNGNANMGASIVAACDGNWTDGSDQPTRLAFSTTPNGSAAPLERMRIDQYGRALIGRQSEIVFSTNTTDGVVLRPNRIDVSAASSARVTQIRNSTGTLDTFYNGANPVGSITCTTTATAYNTSSDYRLKENVVPLTGAIDRLNDLQVRRFNFIADPDTTVDGFIAHEAQTVVPEAVTGTHDEVDDEGNPVYQGIDQSKLVPLLTAALQEAIAKIETLEAKVAALEAN